VKIFLFGATGMIGQGVLSECLLAPDAKATVAVGRRATGARNDKLREVAHADLADLAPLERELAGHDACFLCLGVSSPGMREAEYTRVTYDLTLAVASVLVRRSPEMAFVYVSGAGTAASERSRVMWARVKGRTENALLALPSKAACMLRPGLIQPLHGIVSRTSGYRIFYALARPLLPLVTALSPGSITTTKRVGARCSASRGTARPSRSSRPAISTSWAGCKPGEPRSGRRGAFRGPFAAGPRGCVIRPPARAACAAPASGPPLQRTICQHQRMWGWRCGHASGGSRSRRVARHPGGILQ
jgi:hypothetical protein